MRGTNLRPGYKAYTAQSNWSIARYRAEFRNRYWIATDFGALKRLQNRKDLRNFNDTAELLVFMADLHSLARRMNSENILYYSHTQYDAQIIMLIQ
jgi:hypothetical protein